MPNTSEGFYYPDANTNIAPLETVLANMAASSDTVSKQTPRVFSTYAAMTAAIPTPVGGRLAITTQGSGILWQYDGTAAKWVVQNRPTFSNATARDAAIPSPTTGIVAVTGSDVTSTEWRYTGVAWRLWTGNPAFTYAAGFSAYTGSGWSGISLSVRGGMCTINGAFAATSWTALSTVLTLPTTCWPAKKTAGQNGEANPDGTVKVADAGASAASLTVTWPIAI